MTVKELFDKYNIQDGETKYYSVRKGGQKARILSGLITEENFTEAIAEIISQPLEAEVSLPSKEEAEQQAKKVYGSDGKWKFSQLPSDDDEKNRALAEAFLHGCHYMRYSARSK